MDDLRKKFLDELEEDLEGVSGESEFSKEPKKKITKAKKVRSTGLTTSQIFIIASLLFFLILTIGFFVMLLAGKMVV